MQPSKPSIVPTAEFSSRILDTLKTALVALDAKRRITYASLVALT